MKYFLIESFVFWERSCLCVFTFTKKDMEADAGGGREEGREEVAFSVSIRPDDLPLTS